MRTDLANKIIEYGQQHPDEWFDIVAVRRVLEIDRNTLRNREQKNKSVPLIHKGKKLYRGAELKPLLTHTKK